MRSPPRPSSNPRARRRRSKAGASAELNIEELERRFAKFRREHPPQTRIPAPLRGAVLAAMRHGVTPARLRRSCGLSSTQLEQWQQSRGEIPVPSALDAQVPRVFSVVGDAPARGHEPTDPGREQQLELRLDGWSICVRRVDR
ncbi:MAG: hypothetical protein V3T05_12690 [Myxococcota bacterium]